MPLKILALQFHLFLITQVRCFILYEASVSLLHLLSIFIIPSLLEISRHFYHDIPIVGYFFIVK